MKKFLYIVMLLGLFSCTKQENEFGRLSYQTNDSTNLPMIVKVNGTFVDSVTTLGTWDCYHTDEFILLLAPNSWDVTIYTPNEVIDTSVYIDVEQCKMLEI